MNRKRTQANKSVHQEDTEEAPAKRSRRANQAQNKVFHNFSTSSFSSGCFLTDILIN
jgi:hypothetical protein